ncbi:hypothetical protein AVEN_126873-1 [Araneus ventricosus]|uniref:Uncharacterized protein n=1 Tax=Araneus ventricosus TaxID=182803 RepID=A0A4Y2C3S5_ARAVE|nr:hypothetical protein AVEN_126873-1 [Araneus ventricosus]
MLYSEPQVEFLSWDSSDYDYSLLVYFDLPGEGSGHKRRPNYSLLLRKWLTHFGVPECKMVHSGRKWLDDHIWNPNLKWYGTFDVYNVSMD